MTNEKSILVVDDDETLLNALEKKFTDSGYTVTVATDGAQALQKMQQTKFAVILTDLHMPNMDGFTMIEQAKQTQNADTPVYVITNLGSDTFCDRALQLGVKQCFVKSMVTLRDVVGIVDREIES